MKRVLCVSALALVAVGCGSAAHRAAGTAAATPLARVRATSGAHLVSPLRLPLVRSGVLPGYLLVADRNNDRILILSPDKRIVWQLDGLRQPDDAFFTPGFESVITNEEFNDTLQEVALASKKILWTYGHAGVAGRSAGYLDAPDDAYRIAGGITSVADIKNCRIVQLRPDHTVLRVLGGSGTFLWVDPEAGLACAALTALEFGDWAKSAWPRLSDAVLAEAATR